MFQTIFITSDGQDYIIDIPKDISKYPFSFIITKKFTFTKRQKVINAPFEFDFLINKSVKSAINFIKYNPNYIESLLSS